MSLCIGYDFVWCIVEHACMLHRYVRVLKWPLSLCVYVCMCVCMCVCVCVCVYACVHVCEYICTCVYLYMFVCPDTYVYAYVHVLKTGVRFCIIINCELCVFVLSNEEALEYLLNSLCMHGANIISDPTPHPHQSYFEAVLVHMFTTNAFYTEKNDDGSVCEARDWCFTTVIAYST